MLALAVDPHSPDTVYAGMGDYTGMEPAGVYKSTDGGASWNSTGTITGNSPVVAIEELAIVPSSPDKLFAVANGGSYLSTDGGISWDVFSNQGYYPQAIDPANQDALFYFNDVTSYDAGAKWIQNTLPYDYPGPATDVTVAPTGQRAVYVATSGDGVAVFQLLCDASPRTNCQQPTAFRRSTLQIKNNSFDLRDRLVWRWTGGATSISEFGDPTDSTDYALCIYDTTAGNPLLALELTVSAGETCTHNKPCWKATKTGFRYNDRSWLSDGVHSIQLKGGTGTHITVKAGRYQMPTPLQPFHQDPQVTVQLVNSAGTCWEATYSTARKNDTAKFIAKSD